MNKINLKLPTPEKTGFKQTVQFKFKKGQYLYTKAQIKATSQKVANMLKQKGFSGGVSVAMRYTPRWHSNPITPVGQDVIINSHQYEYPYEDEQDEFSTFVVYAIKDIFKNEGGCSGKNNDCLYDCLFEVLQNKIPWGHPAKLKKYLGLKRNDKIDIKYIPKIEEKLLYHKINISGDFSYISTKQSTTSAPLLDINIRLTQEHYKLDFDKRIKVHGIASYERIPYFYKSDENNKDNIIYDPETKEERILTQKEFKDIQKNKKSKYVLIPTLITSLKQNKTSLKEMYEQWKQTAELLKKETDNKVNLFKSGTTHNTALNLFYDVCRDIQPEELKQNEAEWIQKASTCALMFAVPYEGEGYKYDYVSKYPSLMRSGMSFPIKSGEFKQMKELEDIKILKYGIYRCDIKSNTPLFQEHKTKHYTHFDLYRARELKLDIKLIQDNQPNALIYTRDKLVTGNQLFGKFIDIMFPLKKKYGKEHPLIKEIINILWGALCEKSHRKRKASETNNLQPKKDRKVIKYYPLNDEQTIEESIVTTKIYKTNFARIMPFLISKARTDLSKIMEPFINNIVWAVTDGFIIKEKPNYIKTGDNLGDLKFEGYNKNIQVIYTNKVNGLKDFKL